MGLLMRPYRGSADLDAIAELISAVPHKDRHLIDFPWRLSAHAPDAADVRLWTDTRDRLMGVAAWQVWWATLDFFIRPGPAAQEVEAAIFDWASVRFRALDAARGRPLPYWVEAYQDDVARLDLLTRHGYTMDDDYTYPLGVDPEFQGRGLGHVLLLAMLGRCRAHGATHLLVETESTRTPALRVYEAAGFRTVARSLRKGQWFSPAHDRAVGGDTQQDQCEA
jgi:ribosomal protein S18 acetylase RimI-like enzyme